MPVLAARDDPFASFNVSLARVVGVIIGVLVGVAALALLQSDVWAVALVLIAGLLIGTLLRIGGGINLQVAISGLLVVALGDPPGYAWTRTWQTCVGALVTVVAAPLLLPPNPAKALRRRLDVLATDLAAEIRAVPAATVTPRAALSAAQAGTLAENLARAERAAAVSPLQRRHRSAIAELRPPIELATALAPLVALYSAEAHELMSRPDEQADVNERRRALDHVAAPTADAVERALTGRPFAEQTATAHTQLLALRGADPRPVSVILRRPLGRMLDRLEAAQ